MKIYMFRAVPLPIIRSLFTVHSALVYVIQVCRELSSRASKAVYKPVWHIQKQININNLGYKRNFTFMWPCIVTNSFVIKNQLDAPILQIYFVMKLYMFRTVRLSIIRGLFTVHSAMVYVIQVCRQLSSRTRIFHPGPARKLSTDLYDIYHCSGYSE